MTKRIFAVLSAQVWERGEVFEKAGDKLQLLNTTFVFLLPILVLCLFTFIDTSSIPGALFAPMRSSILVCDNRIFCIYNYALQLLFCLNPTQTSLVYLWKNPIHRKVFLQWNKYCFLNSIFQYAEEMWKRLWTKVGNAIGWAAPQQNTQAISISEATFTTAWAAWCPLGLFADWPR